MVWNYKGNQLTNNVQWVLFARNYMIVRMLRQ